MIRTENAILTVSAPVTSRDCYNAIQAALNAQLLKWHPDLTADPRAAKMTRRILKAKAQADRLYYGTIRSQNVGNAEN